VEEGCEQFGDAGGLHKDSFRIRVASFNSGPVERGRAGAEQHEAEPWAQAKSRCLAVLQFCGLPLRAMRVAVTLDTDFSQHVFGVS